MANFTSKATGGWDQEAATTWNEAGHPQAGDDVSVGAGHTITLESATACATLTIASTGEVDTTGTNYALTLTGALDVTGTLTCNASTLVLVDVTINDGGVIAVNTASLTSTGDLVIGGGASGLMSVGTGAVINMTNVAKSATINAGGVLGTAATDYDLDLYVTMAVSAGTLIAPIAAGNLRSRAGSTWNTPTTFTHSNGEITFQSTGTITLGNNSTQFYDIRIANFAILNVSTFALTAANDFHNGGGASGTVSITTGTITIAGGLSGANGSVFGTADQAYTLIVTTVSNNTGTIIAPNAAGTFTVSGAWNTPAVFTHSSGTVEFIGATQDIDGSPTFHNFDKHVASAASLTVENTGTMTVEGELDLYGVSGELLSILSDSAGDAFDLVLTGTKGTLQYLSVKDSDASGSDGDVKPIAPTNSTNVSNTTDWFPSSAQPDMQIISVF